MIHISYKLDKSALHGVGLFTLEDLPKGAVVYTASPALDLEVDEEDFKKLQENEKREIRHWGYWIEDRKVWHVDFDVSKFINHSYDATMTQDKKLTSAYLTTTRVVRAGEELTQNYLEFETPDELKARGIAPPQP